MYQVTNNTTGEVQYVAALDGYDPAVWTSVAVTYPTLAMQKADKVTAIMQRLGVAFYNGFTVPANNTPALPVALVGKTLQVRDNTDRTNWLGSHADYSREVNAGNGATLAADFRDAANVTVTVSYSDGLNTLDAMNAWAKRLMKNSWSLKDQVAAAADQATLDAIDITQGWQ